MNKNHFIYILIILISVCVMSGCISGPATEETPEPEQDFIVGTWTGTESNSKIIFSEDNTYTGVLRYKSTEYNSSRVDISGTWSKSNEDEKYRLENNQFSTVIQFNELEIKNGNLHVEYNAISDSTFFKYDVKIQEIFQKNENTQTGV